MAHHGADQAATLNQAIALMERSGEPGAASVLCRRLLTRAPNFLPARIVLAAALLVVVWAAVIWAL